MLVLRGVPVETKCFTKPWIFLQQRAVPIGVSSIFWVVPEQLPPSLPIQFIFPKVVTQRKIIERRLFCARVETAPRMVLTWVRSSTSASFRAKQAYQNHGHIVAMEAGFGASSCTCQCFNSRPKPSRSRPKHPRHSLRLKARIGGDNVMTLNALKPVFNCKFLRRVKMVHCQPIREGPLIPFFFAKHLNRHFSLNSVPLKNTNPKLWCFPLPFVLFSHSTKQRKDALKQLILESTSIISIRSGVLHQDWSEMRVGFDQKVDVPTTHGFLHRTGCFSIVEDLKENQQAYHGPEEQEAEKTH